MLFHVTMTHTPEACPAYHRETMPEVIAEMEKLESVAKDLTIKVHFMLWGAPEHVAYALLETESLGLVAQFMNAVPIRQEFRVTAVERLEQVIETVKAMTARAKK
jgi:hypothetical protein